jgi:hypothetical protein
MILRKCVFVCYANIGLVQALDIQTITCTRLSVRQTRLYLSSVVVS